MTAVADAHKVAQRRYYARLRRSGLSEVEFLHQLDAEQPARVNAENDPTYEEFSRSRYVAMASRPCGLHAAALGELAAHETRAKRCPNGHVMFVSDGDGGRAAWSICLVCIVDRHEAATRRFAARDKRRRNGLTRSANPYEHGARLAKALALTEAAVALAPADAPADVAEALSAQTDVFWTDLARHAGVNPPSAASRALVVELLRQWGTPAGGVQPRGHGPCEFSCGRAAAVTYRAADGRWYRCCGVCYADLGTTATASQARTIQGAGS